MTQPALDVLLPPGSSPARLEPQADEAALVALVERGTPAGAGRAQRLVRANMIATLDGGATGPDHVTGSINGPADLRVFRALRVLADVVLVGAGTVRQERYRDLDLPAALERTRRDHGRPDPVRLAVVTAAGDLPDELLASSPRPIVVTSAACPRLEVLRDRLHEDLVVVGETEVDLAAALAELEARGLRDVLAEGGPTLLGRLVGHGLVDELFLTWSPTLVGGPARRIVDHVPWFAPPHDAHLVHLLHAEGVLLGRWSLRERRTPRAEAAEHASTP